MPQPVNFFRRRSTFQMAQMGCSLSPITYPLDLVAGATGGFSLRLLTTTYSGALIKAARFTNAARTTSDTVDIPSNGAFLDCAALLAYANGGDGGDAYLHTAYNQDGSGNDLVQATMAISPQIVSGGALYLDIAGYPCIHFNGASYLESAVAQSNFLSTTAGTVFALWQADTATSTTDGNTIWCNRGGWNGTFIKSISSVPNIRVLGYDGNEDFVTTAGFSLNTLYITVWGHGGGTLYSYVDSGTAVGSIAHGTETDLSATLCWGRASQTVATSIVFSGKSTELLTYDTLLSGANINTIGNSIASPFGTTWT